MVPSVSPCTTSATRPTPPAGVLVGFTPGDMEGFFRDSGRPATDDGPAPPVDDDEIARTMVAAPRYGVEAVAFAG